MKPPVIVIEMDESDAFPVQVSGFDHGYHGDMIFRTRFPDVLEPLDGQRRNRDLDVNGGSLRSGQHVVQLHRQHVTDADHPVAKELRRFERRLPSPRDLLTFLAVNPQAAYGDVRPLPS